jgi:hypothetical protein
MDRLHREVALLEMRSEQLRIHLASLHSAGPEARKVRAQLLAMQLKLRTLKRFSRDTRARVGWGTITLH